ALTLRLVVTVPPSAAAPPGGVASGEVYDEANRDLPPPASGGWSRWPCLASHGSSIVLRFHDEMLADSDRHRMRLRSRSELAEKADLVTFHRLHCDAQSTC